MYLLQGILVGQLLECRKQPFGLGQKAMQFVRPEYFHISIIVFFF